MIILISGSVGTGKTSIAKELSNRLNFKLIHLNEIAKKFKLKEIRRLDTFDFDLDKLLDYIEVEIKKKIKLNENLIIESHFSHFIDPNLVDFLFIINRNLNELKKEYINRKYNQSKIKDNLEVEAFNLCFYESIENGFGENVDFSINNNFNNVNDNKNNKNNKNINKRKLYSIENSNDKSINDLIFEIINIINF